MQNYLLRDLSSVFNISEAYLNKLQKAGIITLKDLLFFLPQKVQSRKIQPKPDDIEDGDLIVIDFKVKHTSPTGYRSRIKLKVEGEYSGIPTTILYFNKVPGFLLKKFYTRRLMTLQCKARWSGGTLQIVHPMLAESAATIPELEVIYTKIAGISNNYISRLISTVLKEMPDIEEWLSPTIVSNYQMPSFKQALKSLHQPTTPEDLKPDSIYMQRLALDELFASQLALKISRKLVRETSGEKFQPKKDLQNQILNSLNFTLTQAQSKVLSEIESDQSSSNRMLRLLQGDVGSGKTLVALMSLVNVTSAGGQVAFMAPTDILATQHFEFFKQICEQYGLTAALLTGKNTAREKRQTLKLLKEGEIDLLVGTHALFQDKIEFNNLCYIIVDEQHRFGVKQRIQLVEKGEKTDLLIMTATPIPRSLTLTLFGDLAVSRLTSKPAGRQPISTSTMPTSKENELMSSLHKVIDRGEQIYWVCPLIEPKQEHENEETPPDVMDASTRYQRLLQYFPESLACLHGRLKADVKERIMNGFRDKQYMILVSTTVIEVGVDVKDATLIIIENADRFGLAQLHQLRGRVGRGDKKSYCILLYNQKTISETGKKRLSVMKHSEDGFYIAESDLKLRGSGELIGTKQSGQAEFIFADIYSHKEFLDLASNEAEKGVKLYTKLNKELLSELLNIFGYNSSANAILG